MALSAMAHLELPHVNVLSKCDLAPPEELSKASPRGLNVGGQGRTCPLSACSHRMRCARSSWSRMARCSSTSCSKGRRRASRLNAAVASIVTDHNLVSFVALDLRDEDSIALTLAHIDSTTQWGRMPSQRIPAMRDSVLAWKRIDALLSPCPHHRTRCMLSRCDSVYVSRCDPYVRASSF